MKIRFSLVFLQVNIATCSFASIVSKRTWHVHRMDSVAKDSVFTDGVKKKEQVGNQGRFVTGMKTARIQRELVAYGKVNRNKRPMERIEDEVVFTRMFVHFKRNSGQRVVLD